MKETDKRINILLADDDDDDRAFFKECLTSINTPTQLISVKNGDRLMDYLANGLLPDIIFLDINMPRKSGLDCLREIRAESRYNHIPILMFSTSSHLKDIDEAFSMGANLYIPKSEFFKDEAQAVASIFSVEWKKKLLTRDKNKFVLQGKIVYEWTKG